MSPAKAVRYRDYWD